MSAMKDPIIVSYQGGRPDTGDAVRGPESAVIGRVRLGPGVELGQLVTIRADGHDVSIGPGCQLLDRATVHIADSLFPTHVGARVTVGRYALVHACAVADDCVIGDAAVVMDDAQVGPGAVIAAGALVPPGKNLDGGWLYDGNPARPVRAIEPEERERMRAALIAGGAGDPMCWPDLPPLDMDPYLPKGAGAGPRHEIDGQWPRIDGRAFVAGTALVAGDILVGPDVSIWFATVLRADGARITIGPRSNIQDNSILLADADRGPITIGADVTVGHNVRMGACIVEDEALIGMGAEMGDGVVVEPGALVGARALVAPGTVVKAGHIWAGRPASAFRPVTPKERDFFRRGKDVYVNYAHNYLAESAA